MRSNDAPGAGLAGLALTSVSNITQLMTMIVRMGTELEMNMNSVERVLEYTDEAGEVEVTMPAVRCGSAHRATQLPLPELACP